MGDPPPSTTTPLEQHRWFIDEVHPFEKPLRLYLGRSLPSFADVDDLLQDIYARLLHARRQGAIRSTKPFLFAVARNAVRDFLRQGAKANLEALPDNVAVASLEENGGLVEMICQREERELMMEAIFQLPKRCQEVVVLRKIKGLSQREIAELLGIAEHTVEAHAVKGMRLCAEFLAARGMGRKSPHGE